MKLGLYNKNKDLNINDNKVDENKHQNMNSLIIKNYLNEDIIRINNSVAVIENKKNYIQLAEGVAPRVDAVFKSVPEIAEVISNKDVYEVIYDKGLGTLQKSAKHPGYVLGNIVDPSTNTNYKGSALLKPISGVQQAVGSVFSVMSVATGQYYMDKIDNKLESIFSDVEQIKSFLRDDKKSNLESYEHYFRNVISNLQVCYDNENYKSAVLNELQSIQNNIYSSIQLYKKQINKHKEKVNQKDKAKVVVENISELCELISSYKYSVTLYMYCKLLEIIVSEISDEIYIKSIIDDLNNIQNEHKVSFSEWEEIYNKYINSAKAYKESDILNVVSHLKDNSFISMNLMFNLGVKLVGHGADIWYNKDKEKKQNEKSRQIDSIKVLFKDDSEELKKYTEYLSYYSSLYNKPLKVIKDNNQVYIELLEDNNNSTK